MFGRRQKSSYHDVTSKGENYDITILEQLSTKCQGPL